MTRDLSIASDFHRAAERVVAVSVMGNMRRVFVSNALVLLVFLIVNTIPGAID